MTDELLAYYRSAGAANAPKITELVGLAVQMADLKPLTGAEKLQLVKAAVVGAVQRLDLTAEDRLKLEAGLVLVEELAETSLSLLKANTQLRTCLINCFNQTSRELKLPFPLIS